MTNQRLIHEHGLLWRQTDRIEAIDIDDVTVTQGPIARMVGVGNVKIVSSDQSTPLFYLRGIDDAREVATMIDEIRRKERRKRGVHIESV
jgi:membrane protein YdbS with pleckstrin-like domain